MKSSASPRNLVDTSNLVNYGVKLPSTSDYKILDKYASPKIDTHLMLNNLQTPELTTKINTPTERKTSLKLVNDSDNEAQSNFKKKY